MAFIPDEAIDYSFDVTPTAFKVYCFICRRRNHQRQFAWITMDNLMTTLGLSKSVAYEAANELEKKGWLDRHESAWKPLKGDFYPVDRRYNP